jgi:hypothetical protein
VLAMVSSSSPDRPDNTVNLGFVSCGGRMVIILFFSKCLRVLKWGLLSDERGSDYYRSFPLYWRWVKRVLTH